MRHVCTNSIFELITSHVPFGHKNQVKITKLFIENSDYISQTPNPIKPEKGTTLFNLRIQGYLSRILSVHFQAQLYQCSCNTFKLINFYILKKIIYCIYTTKIQYENNLIFNIIIQLCTVKILTKYSITIKCNPCKSLLPWSKI